MSDTELLKLMVEVITVAASRSKAAPITIEEAATAVLERGAGALLSSEAETFLIETVTGVERFRHVCEGALAGYCLHSKRNKSDRTAMHLIAYLVIFRHREFTPDRLLRLIRRGTAIPRLVEYLGYLVDVEAVRECSAPMWLEAYDSSFIEGVLIKELTAAAALLRSIASTLTVTKAPTKESDCHGSEDEKTMPLQTLPLQPLPPQPLPPSPPNVPRLAGEKPAARKRALPPAEVREMAHTIPAPRPPPVKTSTPVLTPSPAVAPKLVTRPVGFSFLDREAARLPTIGADGEQLHASPPPAPFVPKAAEAVRRVLDTPVDVPTTNAAVRREAHTHRQRRAEEERVLRNLEVAQLDGRAFAQWREAEFAKAAHQREILLLERHLARLETEESTRAARAAAERKRRMEHQIVKQAAAAEAKQRRSEAARQRAEQRDYVSGFREELARNRREAAARAAAEKQRTAEDVKLEIEAARAAVREADERRWVAQALIIQEVRSLRERVRQRQLDLAEERRAEFASPAVGSAPSVATTTAAAAADAALDGMSMAQLREELRSVRERDKALEEERRQANLVDRTREADERAALERMCREQRVAQEQRRQLERARRKGQVAVIEAVHGEAEAARMLALRQKLAEKRQGRRSEQRKASEAERRNRNESNIRAIDEGAMERERWRQLEQGLVNRISGEQTARMH